VPPYLFPIDAEERGAYDNLRIDNAAAVKIKSHA
jgi:hypothetical protein